MSSTRRDPLQRFASNRLLWAVLMVVACCSTACSRPQPNEKRQHERPVEEPSPWKEFVKVKGQPLPVPKQWLSDEEAVLAHNLVLPQGVGDLMVPFDFEAAKRKAADPSAESVSEQYFKHLCYHEAGEWIFRETEPQDGYFNARPPRAITEAEMLGAYTLEAPVLQDSLTTRSDNTARFEEASDGPNYWYRWIEERRTNRPWLISIDKPYFRAFGYLPSTYNNGHVPGRPVQFIGINRPTAKYGVTWRGIIRAQDRIHRIAGYEYIVYNIQTSEVLGVRRQFNRMAPLPHKPIWSAPERCAHINRSDNYVEMPELFLRLVVTSSNPKHDKHQAFIRPLPPATYRQGVKQ